MQTHELTFAGSVVTKRYTSWERGEHRREWAALGLVHRYAPGSGPRPVAAELAAVPPTVTMTRVPGTPLGGTVTVEQVDALVVAIGALWRVPSGLLGERGDDLAFARRLTAGARPLDGITAAAYVAAVEWWDGPDPALLRETPATTVLGHGDANLANYLWDGQRVRIVDFEDAAVSDPAAELAILIEHLSTRDIPTDRLRAAFAVDERRLLANRRLWAMFWLRLLLPGGPAARRNPPGTADVQARRLLGLLQPTR